MKLEELIKIQEEGSQKSLAELFVEHIPQEERLKALKKLSVKEQEALLYDWNFNSRPKQRMPNGNWVYWMLLAGRGFGKTRVGAETVRQLVCSGQAKRIAFVGPTTADVRDTMIGDPNASFGAGSSLMDVFPKHQRPLYIPSKRLIQFHNGAVGFTYSAEEPEQLRGPQHDFAWCDELCAWQYPEAFDMLQFGLRLGDNPRAIITTTPKPIPIIKTLLKDPDSFITKGSTFENKTNLAGSFIKKVVSKYEGTRLGRQELEAELLDDNPGALWQRSHIESLRLNATEYQRIKSTFKRVVVALDPAVTSGEDSDETGIVVAAVDQDGLGYVLHDESGKYSPAEWAQKALQLYALYDADRIVAETNQGGEMVEQTIRTYNNNVSYRGVRASKGKFARAEPVAALYEQRKVFHIGSLGKLEDQMCDYDPSTAKKSPDRMDALVWALTDLMITKTTGEGYLEYYKKKVKDGQKQ